MKTVYRLILKSYLGPMILTFFIVMFILMMNFMWQYVDELVGKGLGLDVILELMFYASANMIPMGLPLATLLAAIMTMGNLGENYELLAMKSAGMSLPRILRPLIIVVFFIAVGGFFAANNFVPYSNKKFAAILYDVRRQKQNLDFQDGVFFNGIENMSIRVGHKNPQTNLLSNILIYDTRDANGNMTTTIADSGYIRLSDDKKYLLVTLFEGQTYETTRNYQWHDKSAMRHHIFSAQDAIIPLSGFDFERTSSSLFSGSQTMNIAELESEIDSLTVVSSIASARSYEPLLRNYLITRDTSVLGLSDSLKVDYSWRQRNVVMDSIEMLNVYQKKELWSSARNMARNSRNLLSFDEQGAKDTLNKLYRDKVEWHKKISLPVSIIIFFLIGAPLGAIIRRGGLGMPVVVSVIFFIIYYIISMMGEKMTKEGTWSAVRGMWFSTFILAPIAIYLTYKATNDSNLLNSEWYYQKYELLRDWVKSLVDRLRNRRNERKLLKNKN